MIRPAAVTILDVPVHDVTMSETLDHIGQLIAQGGAHQICTVNPEFIMAAQNDPEFKRILQQSALNVPDGVGVLWAARRLKQPLRERVAGSDLIGEIADRAAQTGWKLFLLGAAEGIADRTATLLRTRYPSINIVGVFAGRAGPEGDEDSVARLRAAAPDVVLVAYGAPKQNKWIDRNLARTGAAVGIGVGGAFDFMVGAQRRAPPRVAAPRRRWVF
jgi:N-acetylglucosaminyldiphosphoundecaprenol N-acetyl-beta-D-mannosaminyltransferase